MATKYLDYAGLEYIITKLYERGFNGMGLSHEDFTAELQTRLSDLYNTLKDFDPNSVASDSTLTQLQAKVNGLEAVINSAGTADGDKIINKLNEVFAFLADVSSDDKLKAILDGKVDKVTGKGLSTNDYTAADKGKVANLPDNTVTELGKKVDKVTGKGLSTNDYTDEAKAEVAKVASKANAADVYTKTAADGLFVKEADITTIDTTEIDNLINPA